MANLLHPTACPPLIKLRPAKKGKQKYNNTDQVVLNCEAQTSISKLGDTIINLKHEMRDLHELKKKHTYTHLHKRPSSFINNHI